MSIAYLANSFPEQLEPYVGEEICELRNRGQEVIPCSIRKPRNLSRNISSRALYAFPLRGKLIAQTIPVCLRNFHLVRDLFSRLMKGPEPVIRRLRGIVHTWLGIYLAIMLREKRVTHIHVHHGYFSSWVGMVAARILGAGFSLTLHGSDLLVRGDYLDIKLGDCKFVITVSEFNRHFMLGKYPWLDPGKVLVSRLGIDTSLWRNDHSIEETLPQKTSLPLIFSVGRLHPVKNHGFLIRACRVLKYRGVPFRCAIAGDGEQRHRLEKLIRTMQLGPEVELLGYVPRERLSALYAQAQVVVLTSLSEGIPVTLMEAMAMERLVLAPNITGIPELVADGETGFLYQPDSLNDLVQKLERLLDCANCFLEVRHAARQKVEREFNRETNLKMFADQFLERTGALRASAATSSSVKSDANPVLQQVQLPI